ncbi:hypothetical protein BC941DRAFT_431687 [Chlamydoabsidia padenii]|nr:hypothetical protein BC941DRAFT_431687 [Chlamydoabsidia padenii]
MSIHFTDSSTLDAKSTPSSSARQHTNDRSGGTSTLFTGCASCDSAALTSSPYPRLLNKTAVQTKLTSHQTRNNNSSTDLADESSNRDHDSDEGSFKKVLSYLQKNNNDWAQHMDTVEQLEDITFLRVMYLGVTTVEERRLVLKKLSDGLSRSLHLYGSAAMDGNNSRHTTPLTFEFHERKHHLLPLRLFSTDDDDDDDPTAIFEDNGVYIVEADFTTDNYHRQDTDLIASYIYHHSQRQHSISTLQLILNRPNLDQRLGSSLYPHGDGIDLCVYFYHDSQSVVNVSNDLDLLWKISALQIPILPLLSMSKQQMSSPRGIHTTSDSDESTRHIQQRRNDLAQLLSLWRIKTMDFANLDMLDQPSFQRTKPRQELTPQDMQIEQRLGALWAASSIVPPMPYHVLTLFQFLAIDKWAVSKLLGTIKLQTRHHWHNENDDAPTAGSYHHSTSWTSSTHTSGYTKTFKREQGTGNYSPKHLLLFIDVKRRLLSLPYLMPGIASLANSQQVTITLRLKQLYVLPFLFVLLVYALWMVVANHQLQQSHTPSSWHASLVIVSYQTGQSVDLMLNVYDDQGQPRWTPEIPQIETNIQWMSPSTTNKTPITVGPLPNKTRSLDGQYFYSIALPPCSLLNDNETYIAKVKPSMVFPTIRKHFIQGSPLHISRHILCDTQQQQPIIVEAWRHFMQYSGFYLINSIKIIQMVFTEGQE